jgi:hypothetical protein
LYPGRAGAGSHNQAARGQIALRSQSMSRRGLHQVMVHLKPAEATGGPTTREAKICVGGFASAVMSRLPITIRLILAGYDVHGARQGILAQGDRLEKFLKQDFAGMRIPEQRDFSRGRRWCRHSSVLHHPIRNMRHWSLMPIACCPFRSAFDASTRLSGGMRKSLSFRA